LKGEGQQRRSAYPANKVAHVGGEAVDVGAWTRDTVAVGREEGRRCGGEAEA
jgi:hypothetical protein